MKISESYVAITVLALIGFVIIPVVFVSNEKGLLILFHGIDERVTKIEKECFAREIEQ